MSSFATAFELQLKSVLIASDFTAPSRKALHHAIAVARYYGSKLYFVHVVSGLGLTIAGPDAITTTTDLTRRDAQLAAHDLLEKGILEGLSHEIVITNGDIWQEVQQIICRERIDLAVVGTHSRTGISRLVYGSVAEQIFRRATCPVLTVGPNAPAGASVSPGTRPVLFATDFGENSFMALRYALSFAKQQRTSLILLHVLSPVPHVDSNRLYTADDVFTMRAAARSKAVERLRGLVPASFGDTDPLCIAEFGEAAEWILRISEELRAGAIIMGLNHTTHITARSHFLSSTTYKVACRATCPVLTVRSELQQPAVGCPVAS